MTLLSLVNSSHTTNLEQFLVLVAISPLLCMFRYAEEAAGNYAITLLVLQKAPPAPRDPALCAATNQRPHLVGLQPTMQPSDKQWKGGYSMSNFGYSPIKC